MWINFAKTCETSVGIPCLTEVQKNDADGSSTLVFEVGGLMAAVSLTPSVPRGEAENAARNYAGRKRKRPLNATAVKFWFSVLSRDQDPRDAGSLQVQLVRTACKQAGVLGIYANGTVYQPEFYHEAADAMSEELPLLNLVWLGLYRREGGLCGYTDGLQSFGKDEIEVLDTDAAPGALRSFLFDLAGYVVTGGCDPARRRNPWFYGRSAAAYHPQHRRVARWDDLENQLSGRHPKSLCMMIAAIQLNCPAAYAAGQFLFLKSFAPLSIQSWVPALKRLVD